MASSATLVLNNSTNVSSSLFCASPLSSSSHLITSTPAPSPTFLLRRRRLLHRPPTLKKRKHCDNYNTTPAFTTQSSSSSFLPIQTKLPYLDFGDDEEEANANQTTTSCNSRNSLVFPSLPRITLKKRTTNNRSHCFLSSSPQNLCHEEEEEVREQAPQEEEAEEVIQAQQDQEDRELEEPASRRRRTCSAPSSFTTITANDIVENVPFTPIISSTTAMNNNSISSMTRSVSLQFSLSLMNLSTAATTSSSSSQQQQQCGAATAALAALPKRNSLLQLSKSISTMSLELLNGSSSLSGSGRSSPVTTTFDYLATAMRFPDVAIGLSI